MTELTPVQAQIVKTIEKAIEKEKSAIISLDEKLKRDLQKMEDRIADLKGFYKANRELLERSIQKYMEALAPFQIVEEEATEPPKKDAPDQDCEIEVKEVEKEDSEYASEEHKKQVEDLPWEAGEGDLPFKNVFSKK